MWSIWLQINLTRRNWGKYYIYWGKYYIYMEISQTKVDRGRLRWLGGY